VRRSQPIRASYGGRRAKGKLSSDLHGGFWHTAAVRSARLTGLPACRRTPRRVIACRSCCYRRACASRLPEDHVAWARAPRRDTVRPPILRPGPRIGSRPRFGPRSVVDWRPRARRTPTRPPARERPLTQRRHTRKQLSARAVRRPSRSATATRFPLPGPSLGRSSRPARSSPGAQPVAPESPRRTPAPDDTGVRANGRRTLGTSAVAVVHAPPLGAHAGRPWR
jgi:hypothetical protein